MALLHVDFIVFPSGLCFNYADPVIQSGIH